MSIRSVLTHPCMAFVVVVVACLFSRTFYPLNNFPMYADPGPEPSEFVVVSDALDAPGDIQSLTGDSGDLRQSLAEGGAEPGPLGGTPQEITSRLTEA